MSYYEEETPERYRAGSLSSSLHYESASKTHMLSDLALSKLESKLESQRGSPTLNLADAFIGDEGCEMVAQFIKENPGIQTLELRGNNITPTGLSVLTSVLKGNSLIKHLSLEWNSLGNGTAYLADALAFNNSLQSLDLRNNRIGPEGASHLARMIETNRSLLRMDLRWNEIGASGARSFIFSLSKAHTVNKIELSGNKIPEDLLQQIEKLLKTEAIRSPSRISSPGRALATPTYTAPDNTMVPARLLNKEKEYSDELQAKYEAQILAHSRTEARISELEIMLEQESKRSSEIRNELLKELENERMLRSQAEDSILMLKEENLRREMEDSKAYQEVEYKFNKALNEKNLLSLELANLQEHYEKAQQASQDRIRTLEERLAQQQRLYKQLDETSKASYERSKRDHSEEVKEISRDYESKLESAEDLIHQLRGNKDALEKEISNLRASINQMKASHRDEISEVQDKVREEETQKFNNTLRNLEQRMKSVEEARETLTKRNQDLQREMLRNEKRNMEQILSLEATVNHLRDDKADLQDQLHNALNTIEMLRNEIQMNNSTIERLQNENEELTVTMNQRKEAHLEQLEQMANEHFSEKKKLEYAKEVLNNRLNDLEKQLSSAVLERDRNLRDLEKLADDLKNKLGNYVQDAILNHVRKQEEDKY